MLPGILFYLRKTQTQTMASFEKTKKNIFNMRQLRRQNLYNVP